MLSWPLCSFTASLLPLVETRKSQLVEPETAGDPMSEQKWLRSSLRSLSERLDQAGHQASAPTVSRLLQKHDYALRVNAKKKEGCVPPFTHAVSH